MLYRSSHYLFNSLTGYPVIRPAGYPANETGYPANETGYPANETGYPANETGYPANQTGYLVNRISGATLTEGSSSTGAGTPSPMEIIRAYGSEDSVEDNQETN